MLRKILVTAIALMGCILAHGQIRTGSDAASGNFVIGIDNYLKLSTASTGSAAFDFSTKGKAFKVITREGCVSVLESGAKTPVSVLESSEGMEEMIIGIHDFTNDRQPELVVALRGGESLMLDVLEYDGAGNWKSIGEISASGQGVSECRIFRQVVTVDCAKGLYTWTYRGGKFQFRGSDGSR